MTRPIKLFFLFDLFNNNYIRKRMTITRCIKFELLFLDILDLGLTYRRKWDCFLTQYDSACNKDKVRKQWRNWSIFLTRYSWLESWINGMKLQLCGSYLLTHDLSHELRFQLDRKVLGTSCTIPTPNFSIIARSLLPMNIVSSFILH